MGDGWNKSTADCAKRGTPMSTALPLAMSWAYQYINLYGNGRRHRGVACTWCPCALQTSPLDAGSLARHLIFTTNLAADHLRSSICFNIIVVPSHNVRRRMGCSYRSTIVTSAVSVAQSVARLKGKEGLRLLTGEAYRNDGTR
jgi:hypothetical protein